MEKFNFKPEWVCADKQYGMPLNYHLLFQHNINPFIPFPAKRGKQHQKLLEKFHYYPEKDLILCPEGKELRSCAKLAKPGMKRYRARWKDCRACPQRNSCLVEKNRAKYLFRHIYQDDIDKVKKLLKTPEAKKAAILRMTGPESIFGEGKVFHGLRRAHLRRLWRVHIQFLLIALVQNIKRMVKLLKNTPEDITKIIFFSNRRILWIKFLDFAILKSVSV